MTPGETIAAVLPFVCLVAAIFRARLVALALAPSCIGIVACVEFGVDASSASHPIRWLVPVATLVLAMYSTRHELKQERDRRTEWERKRNYTIAAMGPRWANVWPSFEPHIARSLMASLLILASAAPDLLALHPLFWAHTREWPLVPLQIALCGTIAALLLAPERMVLKWLR